MTAGAELAPGYILDAFGDPLYLRATPLVSGASAGAIAPAVEITINGKETVMYAGAAWRLGRDTMCMADAARSARQLTGGAITVAIKLERAVFELNPDEAGSVGAMLIGAAISSVHDSVIWRHLTGKLGLTDEKAAEMLKGIESVPIMQFLESGNVQI